MAYVSVVRTERIALHYLGFFLETVWFLPFLSSISLGKNCFVLIVRVLRDCDMRQCVTTEARSPSLIHINYVNGDEPF